MVSWLRDVSVFQKGFCAGGCICCKVPRSIILSLITETLKPKAQLLFTARLRTKAFLFNHIQRPSSYCICYGVREHQTIVLNWIHQVHQWRKGLAERMWHMHWRNLGTYELWMIKATGEWYLEIFTMCNGAPHKVLQWVSVASPGGHTVLNFDLCQALGRGQHQYMLLQLVSWSFWISAWV